MSLSYSKRESCLHKGACRSSFLNQNNLPLSPCTTEGGNVGGLESLGGGFVQHSLDSGQGPSQLLMSEEDMGTLLQVHLKATSVAPGEVSSCWFQLSLCGALHSVYTLNIYPCQQKIMAYPFVLHSWQIFLLFLFSCCQRQRQGKNTLHCWVADSHLQHL